MPSFKTPTKLKTSGFPKTNAKLVKFSNLRSKSPSIKSPKISKSKPSKSYNFSKFIKTPKAPKVKMAILKKAVKAKIKGF